MPHWPGSAPVTLSEKRWSGTSAGRISRRGHHHRGCRSVRGRRFEPGWLPGPIPRRYRGRPRDRGGVRKHVPSEPHDRKAVQEPGRSGKDAPRIPCWWLSPPEPRPSTGPGRRRFDPAETTPRGAVRTARLQAPFPQPLPVCHRSVRATTGRPIHQMHGVLDPERLDEGERVISSGSRLVSLFGFASGATSTNTAAVPVDDTTQANKA